VTRGGVGGSDRDIGASVLVPVLNEEAHIERAIGAVLAQSFERELEVLVVDGGSDDRTQEILERLAREDPRVRVLSNPQRLIPNALNIGLHRARGEYIARMDAHTYYPPDYIARAVERFEAGGVECVSGPQLPHGEDRWSRRVALALSTRLGIGGASFRNPPHEIEVDTAFTGVWRRRTLLELGGWDERWPINEDAELAARIREAGGRYVSIPAMAARYVPRNSLAGLALQYWRYGKYRAKTARHHATGLRRSHVLPPAAAIVFAAAILAPGHAGRLARRVLPAYGVALAVGTAEAAADGGSRRDLVWLPLVFAVMHLSWGAGFLIGCVRFGPPVAALARLLGGSRGTG
jgi:glycosyltransferase involved in cell wall biosynthesis